MTVQHEKVIGNISCLSFDAIPRRSQKEPNPILYSSHWIPQDQRGTKKCQILYSRAELDKYVLHGEEEEKKKRKKEERKEINR